MKNLIRYFFTYSASPELRHVRARMGSVHSGSLLDYEYFLRLVSSEIGIRIDDDWMCHFHSGERNKEGGELVFPLDCVSGIVLSSDYVYIRLFRNRPLIWAISRDTLQIHLLEQPMVCERLKQWGCRMRDKWILFRVKCMWAWLNIRASYRNRRG